MIFRDTPPLANEIDWLRRRNTVLTETLMEIRAELGAALIQVAPRDDKIIVGHINASYLLARAALAGKREAEGGK